MLNTCLVLEEKNFEMIVQNGSNFLTYPEIKIRNAYNVNIKLVWLLNFRWFEDFKYEPKSHNNLWFLEGLRIISFSTLINSNSYDLLSYFMQKFISDSHM